jgi:signal transduction histidine kinase
LIDGEVVIEATIGRSGSVTWIGQRYSVDYFSSQPLVRKAIETLEPVFGGQLSIESAAPEFRAALADVKHVAVLPLVHGGKAIGMLVLSRYVDRAFGPHDQATLTLIGAISGLALRNARLYDEVVAARQQADETAARLRSAVEAAEEVASQTQVDQVLIHLLQGACAAVGAEGASLARLEGKEMVLESTITGEGIGTRWPLAPKVLAGVQHGRPVELSSADYTGTPEGLERMVQPYGRFLVVPLQVGGETMGLLALGRTQERPFEANAIQSLQQFATLGGLLLRNARLMAQAKEAERAKSEFMSFAVHELRAPLTVTSGYIGMALEGGFGQLPQSLARVLEIAQRKTEEAKILADELLTVARLEGRVLKPHLVRLSMNAAVQEALARARPRAELTHASIEVAVPPGLDSMADAALVGKILDNLLNNALSYADGPASIRVNGRSEGGEVVIDVADDGIGISKEDQGRIFQRFTRGTAREVLEKSGTGLGLYVSRGLAEQMGGSLALSRTEPGNGSTFVLRLPAAA